MGALLVGLEFSPLTRGTTIEKTEINQEPMEHSLTGDPSKDSKESPSHGELMFEGSARGNQAESSFI